MVTTNLLDHIQDFVSQSSHNLDIYLHAIAGYQGELGEFRLVIDRDSALVNKSADVLPEKY